MKKFRVYGSMELPIAIQVNAIDEDNAIDIAKAKLTMRARGIIESKNLGCDWINRENTSEWINQEKKYEYLININQIKQENDQNEITKCKHHKIEITRRDDGNASDCKCMECGKRFPEYYYDKYGIKHKRIIK